MILFEQLEKVDSKFIYFLFNISMKQWRKGKCRVYIFVELAGENAAALVFLLTT